VILPWAALALGVPLGVALTVPALLTWRRARGDDGAALGGQLSAQIVDALAGAPELLVFGAAPAALGEIDAVAARADALDRRHAHTAAASVLVIQVCLAAAVTSVLALGVSAVHDHTLGQVMVAVLPLAALATFETVPAVPLAFARAAAVRASADRLYALEDVAVPVRDPASPASLPPGVPALGVADAALRYAPGLPRALDGITFDLVPGGRLALTGSSGAGKTSVVNALLRYWPLEAGTLALSGTDVELLDQRDTRSVYAVADQRAHMFAGTIRTNLTLARPDATDDELAAALRTARLDTWVASLPEGLETPVGEDGVAISGGERRRLAVARALLSPRPVIVLDEPTTGLDPGLADELLDGVLAAAAGAGRSVLVITHRPVEAARCDVVLALEAGRVADTPAVSEAAQHPRAL
jgi:ABC-type transport system involved in cytochrome bd biosynthesis fused ATPase/permease subunit